MRKERKKPGPKVSDKGICKPACYSLPEDVIDEIKTLAKLKGLSTSKVIQKVWEKYKDEIL